MEQSRDVSVRSWREGALLERIDSVVIEEPLELRVDGEPLSLTMRTPGNDQELALGFLWGEGILHTPHALPSVESPGSGPTPSHNVLTLRSAPDGLLQTAGRARGFLLSSSCGVCGSDSIAAIADRCGPIVSDLAVSFSTLQRLQPQLRSHQAVFERTGGLHAAALFDGEGRLDLLREDVGRHNALDKVVGALLLQRRIPCGDRLLLVSGRLSFDLTQKAAMAGVPILCAVSAPSSLAVELAQRMGITLVGFLRQGTANVYTHPQRILLDSP